MFKLCSLNQTPSAYHTERNKVQVMPVVEVVQRIRHFGVSVLFFFLLGESVSVLSFFLVALCLELLRCFQIVYEQLYPASTPC